MSPNVPRRPLFPKPVPIATPALPPSEDVLERLRLALSRPALTNAHEVARLEEEAAEKLEVPEVVAVSSCTAGLMLVERCLGLRGEVITPSFTFFATAHGLLWNRLTPVLADCDPETLQIDPASISRQIGPETGGILAVHMFGAPAPVEALTHLAEQASIPLIFDAAHALETRWQGRGIAAWGDASVYSLSPTKQLTAGEGGLIATRHRDLARSLRRARNYGKGDGYDCELLGLNARMSELQAALCRCGLPGLSAQVRRRNALAEIYERILRPIADVGLQRIPAGGYSGRKDFAVLLPEYVDRQELAAELAADNIETRTYFDPPLHRQTLYRPFYRSSIEPLFQTERVSRRILCLPLHGLLTDREASLIAGRVAELVQARAVLPAAV